MKEHTEDTLVSLATMFDRGKLDPISAVRRVRALDFPEVTTDPDGTVWINGVEDNHPNAVYHLMDTGRISREKGTEFLRLVIEK